MFVFGSILQNTLIKLSVEIGRPVCYTGLVDLSEHIMDMLNDFIEESTLYSSKP